MNEFSDLEAELKRLAPRTASPQLASRIDSALAVEMTETPAAGVLPRPQRKARVSWFALVLGTSGVAAVVMIALITVNPRSQAPLTSNSTPIKSHSPAEIARTQPASSFVPDGLTRVVYRTRDEGLVYSGKTEAPVRRLRSRARETLQWKEPGTGASLRVSYPTEEVELIPVSGQ